MDRRNRIGVPGLLAAAALLLACLPVGAQAQDPDVVREEPAWRELGLAPPEGYTRAVNATDRAFGRIATQRIELRTHNWGLLGGADGITSSWIPRPIDAENVYIYRNATVIFAVEEGPWHGNAQAHESGDRYVDFSDASWEAIDGARGTQFSNPPLTAFDYPLMAHSHIEDTWPATGWPAPEGTEEVWVGASTWKKWSRKADQELYAEFNDAYADQEGSGEESVLQIHVRKRAMGFPSINGAFVQHEYTNNSSYTYTDVYIGQMYQQFTSSHDGYVYYNSRRRWDERYNLLYGVSRVNYDSTNGTQQDSWYEPAPFGGWMFLESPTGSFRTDALGDTIQAPSTVITRRNMVYYGNQESRSMGRHVLYGAFSGDTEYFVDQPTRLQEIWKTHLSPDGMTPILLQTEDTWKAYRTNWETSGSSFYVHIASGPITLTPGESVTFVSAFVSGSTEQEMLRNADKVVKSYQNQFATSGPPPMPAIRVTGTAAGAQGMEFNPLIHNYPVYFAPSQNITLTWDRAIAETALDPITGNMDFQGYRLYRSDDRGATWGEMITDSKAQFHDWLPYRQWDRIDGITGDDPGDGSYKRLGDDTGLVGSFTDPNIVDGVEYWYSLTTYDYDPVQDDVTPSYEVIRGRDPTASNCVAIIAGSLPNGYVPGSIDDPVAGLVPLSVLTPTVGPRVDGTVSAIAFTDGVMGDYTYRITTNDTAWFGEIEFPNMLGVTLQNLTTGQVLYSSLLPEDDSFGTDLLPVVEGVKVSVNSLFNDYDPYDRISLTLPPTMGYYSSYGAVYAEDGHLSSLLDIDDLTEATLDFATVEVRFDTVSTQMAYYYNRGPSTYQYLDYQPFPGTAWDVSGPVARQINVSVASRISAGGTIDYNLPLASQNNTSTYIRWLNILNSDYSGDATPESVYLTGGAMDDFGSQDAMFFTRWNLAGAATRVQDLHGETARITYLKPVGPDLQYEFSTTASEIDGDAVNLDDIDVVPNPYFIFAEWDQADYRRKLQFINVPANSTVDIYTLSGELVASLSHVGTSTGTPGSKGYYSDKVGTVEWNLWTYEFTEVAYGLYIYVVKSPQGKKVGKFAIIR